MIFLANPEQTCAIGTQLATLLEPPFVIYLSGHLGAGKTTLVRAFLQACNVTGPIKSPTYTIVESYQVKQTDYYHIDCYRINDPEELHYLGIEDYFHQQAITLVEWAEKCQMLLPPADLHCQLRAQHAGRELLIKSSTEKGARILAQIEAELEM